MESDIDKIKTETNVSAIVQVLDDLFERHQTVSDSIYVDLFNALLSNPYLLSNQLALVDIIDYLVKTYKVNIHLYNNTLLTNACKCKMLELIDYILKSGPIDINSWYTYLNGYYNHTLCHPDVLEVFVANSVNINFMNNEKLRRGYTEPEMMRIVEILIHNGYEIDPGLVNIIVMREMLEVVKYILNSQPTQKLLETDMLILTAISQRDTPMIQLLLSRGATIPWDKVLAPSKSTLELQQFLTQLGCTTEQIVGVLLYQKNIYNFMLPPEQHQPSGSYHW